MPAHEEARTTLRERGGAVPEPSAAAFAVRTRLPADTKARRGNDGVFEVFHSPKFRHTALSFGLRPTVT
jgi:hypothetical protein